MREINTCYIYIGKEGTIYCMIKANQILKINTKIWRRTIGLYYTLPVGWKRERGQSIIGKASRARRDISARITC